jgi:hypothetical protein
VAQLDGSLSFDPDGDPLSYSWTFVSTPVGSTTSLTGSASATPSFTPDVAGSYVLRLSVSDRYLATASDTVTLSVIAGNSPPVADAGSDFGVRVGEFALLDGSSSYDPDGDAITFDWELVSVPFLSGAFIDDPTLTFPSFATDVGGRYLVRLTVTDTRGASSSDTIEVTAAQALSCLLISEYVEGSSFNKVVEINNCAAPDAPVASVGLCVVTNESTTCSNTLFLVGTIPGGGTQLVCNSAVSPFVVDPAACAVRSGALNFNGDDRLVLFDDVDGSRSFNAGDTILDAFGQTAVQPNPPPWLNVTYRRCNAAPYLGVDPFTITAYFTAAATDDGSQLGIAPGYGGCITSRALPPPGVSR